MKFRIMSLITLLAFMLSVSAIAYPGAKAAGKNGMRPGQGRVVKELGLSDAQSQQIRDIVKRYRTDVREVAKSTATKADKKARIDTLRSAAATTIDGVLTPEQREKVKQKGLINRFLSPQKRVSRGIRQAIVKLNLTEDQKTRIKGVFETSKVAAQGIKANTALTPEQKKANLIELRKQTHQNVLSILTPEQQQKLKEMKGKKRQPTR